MWPIAFTPYRDCFGRCIYSTFCDLGKREGIAFPPTFICETKTPMRKRKTEVQKILKPAHLQAIGLVAAQWNSLELSALIVLSEIAKINLAHTIIMAGASNIAGSLEMLKKVVKFSTDLNWKLKELEQIADKIQKLQTRRNAVVHACWQDSSPIIASAMAGKKIIPDKAKGTGIPKRGMKILIDVIQSAEEMRDLAREIEDAQSELVLWKLRQQAPLSLLKLAQALQNPQSLQTKKTKPRSPRATSPASITPQTSSRQK
jgi:hypothetical protein